MIRFNEKTGSLEGSEAQAVKEFLEDRAKPWRCESLTDRQLRLRALMAELRKREDEKAARLSAENLESAKMKADEIANEMPPDPNPHEEVWRPAPCYSCSLDGCPCDCPTCSGCKCGGPAGHVPGGIWCRRGL